MVELLPATPAAARTVAQHLRQADLHELQAAHGVAVDSARLLLQALRMSGASARMAVLGGRPIALFGCARAGTLLGGFGVPWLLGTDDCLRQGRALVRLGRLQVRDWHATHGVLRNWVDARNVVSIRWLQRLGFTLGDAVPYGVQGLPFRPFELG